MKVLLTVSIFLSLIACKIDVYIATVITNNNISDSLDIDTAYAIVKEVPKSVNQFFQNAEDT